MKRIFESKIETETGYVSVLTDGHTIDENTGRVFENRGLVQLNNGTVVENRGTVGINQRIVSGNYGKVQKNECELYDNCGVVGENYGKITQNAGIVEINYGELTLVSEPYGRLGTVIDNIEGAVHGECGIIENNFGGAVSGKIRIYRNFFKVTVTVDTHMMEPQFDVAFDRKANKEGQPEMWLEPNTKGRISLRALSGYAIERVTGPCEIEQIDEANWIIKLQNVRGQITLDCSSREITQEQEE